MLNKKRGQTKLSFGMIFSIILIIFFLVFAFFGIKKFLSIQETIKVEQFKSDLQNDITQIWKSSKGSTENTYILPKNVVGVCFRDDENENMYFLPIDFKGKFIDHIDMQKTLQENSILSTKPLCFENSNGKIVISLQKDFGEKEVTLIRK